MYSSVPYLKPPDIQLFENPTFWLLSVLAFPNYGWVGFLISAIRKTRIMHSYIYAQSRYEIKATFESFQVIIAKTITAKTITAK
jgi:hypothetical protein